MEIDLNCDLGEGCAFDAELMPLITSANIACGFHAGGPATAYAALAAAARHERVERAHTERQRLVDHPARERMRRPVIDADERKMMQRSATVDGTAEAVEDVRRLLLVMQRLDRGRQICHLHGIQPGDEIELSRETVITVFSTTHTIPSVGYVVWDRRQKLREEYHGLPGERAVRRRHRQEPARLDQKVCGLAVGHRLRTVKKPVAQYIGARPPMCVRRGRGRCEAYGFSAASC